MLSACSATQLLTEVQTRVAAANARVYAIGDTGPAGGIVFYDKGSYSDGWRFLEVAPSDQNAGNSIQWGDFGIDPNAFGTALGSGKTNTDKIVAAFGPGGYGSALDQFAAGVCASYTLNGFSDWYLPSRDELEQLYSEKFVARVQLTFTYWSSTEYSSTESYYKDTSTGITSSSPRASVFFVRAIRQF